MKFRAAGILLSTAVTASAACHRAVEPLVVAGQSAVALTGGSNTSMIYVARTSDGIIVIDLGWWGGKDALDNALSSLGAKRADVRKVFLTHSHRDHISAWPAVKHADFFLGRAEMPLFSGDSTFGGWIPRWADRIAPGRLPRHGEVTIHSIENDTAFVIGADTMRAYLLPGHTPGSVVYLFRDVLFLGDAMTYSRTGGFAPAKSGFSDDPKAAAVNLHTLWGRLPSGGVRYVCTAHARCTGFSLLPH